MRGILGDPAVDAIVAVRRYEQENYGRSRRGRARRQVPHGLERVSCPRWASTSTTVPLIDHHVHGCWLKSGDRARFENGLNEANTEPVADFDSSFDTQLGFAVRAHCAPVLDLPSHVDADAYWDRRSELGEQELAPPVPVGRRSHRLAGGHRIRSGVADLAEMAEVSGGRTHEIVRLESVAEEAAAAPGDYAAAFEQILAERAATRGRHQVDPGLPRRIRRRPVASRPPPRWPRRRRAGVMPAAAGAPTGCCCGSVCIRRCGWASRCSFTSGSATGIATCTPRTRCICWTFSA